MTSVLTNQGTRWLAALVASALVLALMVGSDQRSAQAIGPGETDIAYVADGYNFPDALMGATLAALNAAPMLGVRSPTTGDAVPPETADELDRLTNDKANPLATIYVFGGPAAVSDKVVGELEAWANDVQRIFGDDRFGTMEAISQALPTKVKNSDLLDGMDSSEFLGSEDKATDSDLLDGMDSSEFASSAVADPFVVQLDLGTFVVLAENGPLTLAAFCEDAGDGTPRMSLKVATSVDPAYNGNTAGSFAPADGFIEINNNREPGPGEYIIDIDGGTAIAEDGGTLYALSSDGEIQGHGEDIFGETCTMNGIVNAYSAPAGLTSDAQPVPAP